MQKLLAADIESGNNGSKADAIERAGDALDQKAVEFEACLPHGSKVRSRILLDRLDQGVLMMLIEYDLPEPETQAGTSGLAAALNTK